jgi:hypothetical protein
VPLLLPARLAVEGKVVGSTTRQQDVSAMQAVCRLKPFAVRRVSGFETILKSGETLKILSVKTATKLEADLVLLVPTAEHPKEIKDALERGEGHSIRLAPLSSAVLGASGMMHRLANVIASWEDTFHLREGRWATEDKSATCGLIRPQIGALHAALARHDRPSRRGS